MKGYAKWLITGAIIIVLGLTAMIIGLGINGWKWDLNDEFEQNSFTATQPVDKLELHAAAGSVYVQFYDGESVQISYPVGNRFCYEVSQNGDEVKLTYKNSSWFGGWLFDFWGVPDTVVNVPQGVTVNLDIELDAGQLFVADGSYGEVKITVNAGTLKAGKLACEQADCKINAGKLEIEKVTSPSFDVEVNAGSAIIDGAECSELNVDVSAGSAAIRSIIGCETAKIDVSAGSATLSFAERKELYTITTDVTAGSCNVQPQVTATDKRIDVRVSAGSANLDFTN